MNILLTGATGFVGRALTLRLQRDGHQVTAWVRNADKARDVLGASVRIVENDCSSLPVQQAVANADAVINLAGEPIVGGRWTESRRRALTASRVHLTRQLVDAMASTVRRPAVLISASAVGYYGARCDEPTTESSPAGGDFLAMLCRAWEGEALRARELGVRVVIPRIGVVLGRDGGALAKMLPAFRLGVGGRLGSGRQPMSWIHLTDLVDAIATAVTDEAYDGAFNAVSPNPVSNAEFTHMLGDAVGRRAVLPVPALALKALFGAASTVLLDGQRAVPEQLRNLGFEFSFPRLRDALVDITRDDGVSITRDSARDVYCLRSSTVIDAPLEQVFEFFSQVENLGALTSPQVKFSIASELPVELRAGATIDYRVKVGPFPLRWRSEIETWAPAARFVDVQTAGPYRTWWHEHTFVREGDRTRVEDHVRYALPLGFLGRVVHRLWVRRVLQRMFAYRTAAIRHRFGTPTRAPVLRAA